MAQLPLDQGIPRFKANEDRINTFANGGEADTFQTSGGATVPSVRKILKDRNDEITTFIANKNTEINAEAASILAGANAAAATATTKAAEANDAAGIATDKAAEATAAAASLNTENLLNKNNNLSEVADPATARTNLGMATVSQAEAEAGTATTVRSWTAQRIAQAIMALAPQPDTVSQAEAEAGTATTIRSWTAQRVRQAILAAASALTGIPASAIDSGTFADARIPNLNASKITAGTLPIARGGTGQTTEAGMRGVYTGSAANNTSFAIGERLLAYDQGISLGRNGNATVRLPQSGADAGQQYWLHASGTALAGTWRSRGIVREGNQGSSVSTTHLMVRTA